LTAATLRSARRVLGNEHMTTLIAVNNLALIYRAEKRYKEAEPLYFENVEGSRRIYGSEHPETVVGIVNLAGLHRTIGDCAKVGAEAGEAIRAMESHDFGDFLAGTVAYLVRGCCRVDSGRYAEAEPDLVMALKKLDARDNSSPAMRADALKYLVKAE